MTAMEYAVKMGFVKAQPIRKWHGYKCYEALLTGPENIDNEYIIGYPQIILEKHGRFRMATYNEAMSYIRALPEDEGYG